MVDEAKRHGVRAIAAVGTAGLRIASNRNAVLATIESRTGVHIEVIPAMRRVGWPTWRPRPDSA